jgi:Zn-dependent protease
MTAADGSKEGRAVRAAVAEAFRAAGTIGSAVMDPSPEMLVLGVTWYVAFLFSLTVHEAAHALAAYRLGDPTAYLGGQVTLNPLPHIKREPFGTILVPILTFAMSGWMMGWANAPYDPYWAARHPKRSGWMALAGPAANLVLVILVGIILRLGLAAGAFDLPHAWSFSSVVAGTGGLSDPIAQLLSILFSLNLLLFAFNLLPLPPLDGASALAIVLPETTALKLMDFLRQPMVGLIGILIAWRVAGYFLTPIYRLALMALFGGLG